METNTKISFLLKKNNTFNTQPQVKINYNQDFDFACLLCAEKEHDGWPTKLQKIMRMHVIHILFPERECEWVYDTEGQLCVCVVGGVFLIKGKQRGKNNVICCGGEAGWLTREFGDFSISSFCLFTFIPTNHLHFLSSPLYIFSSQILPLHPNLKSSEATCTLLSKHHQPTDVWKSLSTSKKWLYHAAACQQNPIYYNLIVNSNLTVSHKENKNSMFTMWQLWSLIFILVSFWSTIGQTQ